METNEACPRCGSTDGKHVGFHLTDELPRLTGKRVRVRAGAEVRTTLPNLAKKRFVLPRSRVVTVHDMDNGMSQLSNDDPHNLIYNTHISDPGICWVGTGGYWHYALLADVELI